jgi:hypothetical protein
MTKRKFKIVLTREVEYDTYQDFETQAEAEAWAKTQLDSQWWEETSAKFAVDEYDVSDMCPECEEDLGQWVEFYMDEEAIKEHGKCYSCCLEEGLIGE